MDSSNSESSPPPPPPPSLEELSMRSATALILPWIIGMSTAATTPNQVAVFVNPLTHSVTLVEGFLDDLESILSDISSKEGPSPASKESIDSLPIVRVSDPGTDCPVCLVEFEVNGEAKEMPCRHRFCTGCIDKWLGINGSCPVCRYDMPVDQEKEIEGTEGRGWAIRVVFVRGRVGTGTDAGQGTGSEEHGLAQEMDIDNID